MKSLPLAAALLLAAAIAPASAQQESKLQQAKSGKFGIVQLSVADPARFEREWAVPTAGAQISTSTTTVANRLLSIYVLFHGCTADAAGKCDITADVAFYDPGGKLENEQAVILWRAKAPATDTDFYLGTGSVGFGTDEKGPFGRHRVVFTVTDNVAKITLTTEQTLTITPATPAK